MPTVSDFLFKLKGGALQGVWVRMVNNLTSTAYVSSSATDANGLYTMAVLPAGLYTVYTGPTNTGPWSATGDANYAVPVAVAGLVGDIQPVAAASAAGVLDKFAAADHAHGTGAAAQDSLAAHLAGIETFTGAKTMGARITTAKDFVHSYRTATEAELVSGLDASLAETVYVTLTASRVMGAPINPVAGHRMKVVLTENGTGGWTLDTSNAALSITNWTLNTAANAITELPLEYSGGISKWVLALNPATGDAPNLTLGTQSIAFANPLAAVDAANGSLVIVGPLTGDTNIPAPLNPKNGQWLTFVLPMDGTGYRKVVTNAVFDGSNLGSQTGIGPWIGPNKVAVLSYKYDGTASKWRLMDSSPTLTGIDGTHIGSAADLADPLGAHILGLSAGIQYNNVPNILTQGVAFNALYTGAPAGSGWTLQGGSCEVDVTANGGADIAQGTLGFEMIARAKGDPGRAFTGTVTAFQTTVTAEGSITAALLRGALIRGPGSNGGSPTVTEARSVEISEPTVGTTRFSVLSTGPTRFTQGTTAAGLMEFWNNGGTRQMAVGQAATTLVGYKSDGTSAAFTLDGSDGATNRLAISLQAAATVGILIDQPTASPTGSIIQYRSSGPTTMWYIDPSGAHIFSGANGSLATLNNSAKNNGDKIILYGGGASTTYAIGVQTNALVLSAPSGAAISFRNAAASGNATSGTEIAKVSGAGLVSVTAAQGLDTLAAGTLNLGQATATAVQVGRTGQSVGFYGTTPVVKAGAITTPNAQTGSYVQADVTSLKTAIDAIRVALTNIGITA